MKSLRQFLRLRHTDRLLLLQIIVALPIVAMALSACGFKRTYVGLSKLAGSDRACGDPETYKGQVKRWVRFVKQRGPFRGNCLSRSLVAWWLLRRRGMEADLHIGTCKYSGKFRAHAWIEHRGQPVNAGPRVRERYIAFQQFPVKES